MKKKLRIDEIDRNIIIVRIEYYPMALWVYKKETIDPAIALLGTYPNEVKTYTETYMWMFIATLFIITRSWKQPRCPPTGEWK